MSNPAARTQPGSPKQHDPATRQPGNPATRQQPGSTRKWTHILTAWQHPAAPGSTRQHPGSTPAPGSTRQPGTDPATPWQPGNPTRQHPASRQPGLKIKLNSTKKLGRLSPLQVKSTLAVLDGFASLGFYVGTLWRSLPSAPRCLDLARQSPSCAGCRRITRHRLRARNQLRSKWLGSPWNSPKSPCCTYHSDGELPRDIACL